MSDKTQATTSDKSKKSNSGSKISSCKCENKYQDEKHGNGMRVFNFCEKGARCTVCGTIK